MVRGHWRRAAPGWKDQRVRWIGPYWKGPDIAAGDREDLQAEALMHMHMSKKEALKAYSMLLAEKNIHGCRCHAA